jgi:hypothetical protein
LRGATAPVQREGGQRAAPPTVELRTHRLADAAGNTLTVVVKVRKTDSELKARVMSLQYNGGAPVTPERNRLHVVLWLTDRTGQLKSLVQDVSQGHGQDKETVGAVYDAKDDESLLIVSDAPRSRPTRTRKNGLVLLRLETDRGQLNIGY